MPRALAPAVRLAICRRQRVGQSVSQIAGELAVPERTVRHVLQQFRLRGEESLRASYVSCGRSSSATMKAIRQRVRKLREQHPRWGAGRLRIELPRWFDECELPCARTVQRWLRTTRRAPSGRPAKANMTRAEQPHQVWQIDAAEQKRLGSGAMISWLRVADECSGAVLKSFVFSPGALQPSSRGPRAGLFAAGFC
jgi:hypothetical protein